MREWPGSPSGPAGTGYDVAVLTVAAGVTLGVLIALLLRNVALGLGLGIALAVAFGPLRSRVAGHRQPGGREPEATAGRPSAGDPW
jgi:hypothetical protein